MSPPSRPGAQGDALAGTVAIVRRRWLFIAAVVAACALVGVLKHERTPNSYKAIASVSFQSGTLSDSALQVSTSGGAEPQREADTEVLIAHSPEVAEGVRKRLHLAGSAGELLGEVNVEAAPNASVLNFVATTHEPRAAAELANAFAEQYIAFRAKSELAGIATAQSKLQQEITELPPTSTERATLQQSLQKLGELRAVAGGGANIIGLATPPQAPSSMSLSTTVIIGVLVGLALAFSLVFVLESVDRRIKSVEEFEAEYRASVLAAIPQTAFRFPRASEREEGLEPFRILRSALDFAAVTRQLDTLLVTSAVSSEGKTTVAVDLAHAIALTGRQTVLVELDLRRPTLAAQLGLSGHGGLTAALTNGDPVGELLVEPFADLPNFSVLTAGRLPQKPSELLGAPQIAEMIAELRTPEGIVIVDAPPLNPVADTQILLNNPAIHAVIVVARLGQTTREEVRRARSILDQHAVDPVGLVVTGMRDGSRYGYAAYAGEAPTLDVDLGPQPSSVASGQRKLRL